MKRIVVIASIAMLSACVDNEVFKSDSGANLPGSENEISVKNDRLAFTNAGAFFKTVEAIHKMNDAERRNWKNKYAIHSLEDFFNSEPSEDALADYAGVDRLPVAYNMILNNKAEVQIGDEIVWYNKGTKHYASGEDELRKLRSNPSLSTKMNTYSISVHPVKTPQDASGRVVLGVPGGVGGYQYETTQCSNASALRKHVFELLSLMDNEDFGGGYSFHSTLYIDIKLEFKYAGSHSWHNTIDYRVIQYDIVSDAAFYVSGTEATLPSYHVWTVLPIYRNTNYQISLFDVGANYFYGTNAPAYNVEITGFITQSQSATPASSTGNPCGNSSKNFTAGSIGGVIW